MSQAWELYQQGQLRSALAACQADDFADHLLRVELYLFLGELDSAYSLLAREFDNPAWQSAAALYHELIQGEEQRLAIIESDVNPPMEGGTHVGYRLAALRAVLREGENLVDEIDYADQQTPHLVGHVDGREFDGLRDSDDLFSSFVEVIEAGVYRWVGFEQIRRLRLVPTGRALDDLYLAAELTRIAGPMTLVHLPVLYIGSSLSDQEAVQLGLETDFFAADGGPMRGIGRRLWLVGDEELTLPDCRQFDFKGMIV